MKNSRTSLNKPFYDWIKEVREADKKIEELEDNLYYYNVKLIGYNSPNFEPRLSSTKPEYKDTRYIWICKISNLENSIRKIKEMKKEYDIFKRTLNGIEAEILECYCIKSKTFTLISRSYKYKILSDIAKKFTKWNINKS